MTSTPYYRNFLNDELKSRMDRNARYSLRAYAQSLKLEPSALSQILAGKRPISLRVVQKLLVALELSDEDRSRFLISVIEEKKSLGTQKVNRELLKLADDCRANQPLKQHPIRDVGIDQFRIISEWYHYAILEMTVKRDFKMDFRWIARRLGITQLEAKLAVERLIGLKIIEKRNNRWVKTELRIDTQDKTKTSISHKRRQRQVLEKSIHSLENDPIEIRSHSGLTLCVDPDQIQLAKKQINEFLWNLSEQLTGKNPARVYELNVQLFPVESGDSR